MGNEYDIARNVLIKASKLVVFIECVSLGVAGVVLCLCGILILRGGLNG